MRWPWNRRPRPEPDREAVEARADADRKLADLHNRQPAVDNVLRRMRDLKERNHFAESIEATYARRTR